MRTVLTGERVRLRPWASGEELYDFSRRHNTRPNEHLGPTWYPLGVECRLFADNGMVNSHGLSAFAIELMDKCQLIGFEAVTFRDPLCMDAEVGTFILEPYRRQGLGIESKQLMLQHLFGNYQLDRVGAWTLATHTMARRGLERCGFTLEGRLRRAYYSRGRYTDRVFYVIWREDWKQLAQVNEPGNQP
ncbi:GNAT family N-acetyltransferase [bacterium]|nr:GNAT family N-acetyltransferase [bacterium]